MSWLSGYKSKPSTSQDSGPSEEQLREAKRQKLQEERLLRAKQRAEHKKQLQSIIQSRKEADQALQDLLDIDPLIFEGESIEITDDEVEAILETSTKVDNEEVAMVDFDKENADDSATALDNLRTVRLPSVIHRNSSFKKEDRCHSTNSLSQLTKGAASFPGCS